eukprot:NODE_4344_length_803_cov_90.517751_g4186_i0.p1 GENE.NODE_4344_length_803_cov_90.517751_g4186_i0~~NODE_4344_length_803_cov_90.517751_g4186_i0.p1  ORF type:complete len:212 (+),score=32.92 NODE_4344_length_803_cov_90.517751_g4186_i0:53-637(+)
MFFHLIFLLSLSSILAGITEETPKYTVLSLGPGYEIRSYETQLRATTQGDSTKSMFGRLARYIGVFGVPENIKDGAPKNIPMTAPVVMRHKAEGKMEMSFILPASRYSTLESVPTPTDANVMVHSEAGSVVAALTFSGDYHLDNCGPKVEQLKAALEAASIQPSTPFSFDFLGYNSPWTPPAQRKNEVLIPVVY